VLAVGSFSSIISPTSAPHSIGGLVAPFHNPRSHSISHSGCNPPTNQSTHKQPVKLHFISQRLFHYTPNPPMLFSNAFPMVYFSYCGESTPKETKRLSCRAVSLLHLIGECLGYRQYKSHNKTPPPISRAEKNIFRVLWPCACGICIPFQLHFVPGSAVVPPLTLHFILPAFQAYTSAPHGFGKYSFPFRKLMHSVFPKPFSNALPTVYIFFCVEFAPINLKKVYDNGKKLNTISPEKK
jgi:hypothetical protein